MCLFVGRIQSQLFFGGKQIKRRRRIKSVDPLICPGCFLLNLAKKSRWFFSWQLKSLDHWNCWLKSFISKKLMERRIYVSKRFSSSSKKASKFVVPWYLAVFLTQRHMTQFLQVEKMGRRLWMRMLRKCWMPQWHQKRSRRRHAAWVRVCGLGFVLGVAVGQGVWNHFGAALLYKVDVEMLSMQEMKRAAS